MGEYPVHGESIKGSGTHLPVVSCFSRAPIGHYGIQSVRDWPAVDGQSEAVNYLRALWAIIISLSCSTSWTFCLETVLIFVDQYLPYGVGISLTPPLPSGSWCEEREK